VQPGLTSGAEERIGSRRPLELRDAGVLAYIGVHVFSSEPKASNTASGK